MTKPVTAATVFATQAGPIPLSQLDTNISNLNAAANDLLTYENYVVDTGAANVYAVTYAAGITVAYTAGLRVAFKAANSNTGASTMNVNALGAKTIVNFHGTALVNDRITSGAVHLLIYDGTNFQLMTPNLISTGTFTGTLTGFTANPTPTVSWIRNVDSVTLSVSGGATATSNATTMTLTGVPSTLYPSTNQIAYSAVVDNGANNIASSFMTNAGVLTFGLGVTGGNFTGSGTKGLQANWAFTYALM